MPSPQLKNNKDTIRQDAILLSEAFLTEVEKTQPATADLLRRARDAMWDGKGHIDQVATYASRLATLEERSSFMRGLVRLGQLYDLSALQTRERAIEESRQNVIEHGAEPLSGGVRDMLRTVQNMSVADATQLLSRPVFEVVMTAHPTNVNAKENIDNLKKLGDALHGDFLQSHENRALSDKSRDAMAVYANDNRILPEKDGLPGSISVSDEAAQIVSYLKNIYQSLPAVYAAFDEPLHEKAKATGEAYDPQKLFLGMRYSSWGSSGDKDGNNKVTAETTLEAIIQHKRAIVQLYAEDLRHIVELDMKSGQNSWSQDADMKFWQTELHKADQSLASIASTLKSKKDSNGFLAEEDFESLREQVSSLGLGKDLHDKFVGALDGFYNKAAGKPDKQLFLDLWRKAKTFDFNFARIEYRETAEEYERVIGALIPDYGALCTLSKKARKAGDEKEASIIEEQKCELLKARILDPGFTESMQVELRKISAAGAGREYDKKDPAPIAYHTLKRMELAREFPEMITANVLAECQNASNILEAVLLQKLSEKDDKRAIMGVVPLFEEPATMKRVDEILGAAYGNEAYQHHLDLVAGRMKSLGLSEGKKTQQVQIAHSDNTRRSGLPAARAFIYEAHEKIRMLNDEQGIKTEFFEGGSNSDPFRGGVRSISAATNMYKLHDFMKFTFQGGDNLGYFNYPGSITRLYARNLSHAAKYIARQEMGNGESRPYIPRTDFDAARIKDNPGINKIVLNVLKGTLDDYQNNVFREDKMGHFLWVTRDDYGNVSSRMGSRKALDITKEKIDPDEGMRTITFSESFQHAGIVPTWIGAHTIEKLLREELEKLGPTLLHPVPPTVAEKMHIVELEGVEVAIPKNKSEPLDPMVYQLLYKHSSVFRDVIDRMAFGLAMTDLDHVTEYYPALQKDPFLQERLKGEFRQAVAIVNCALPNNSLMNSLDPAISRTPARPHFSLEEWQFRSLPGSLPEQRCQMRKNKEAAIYSPQTSFSTLSKSVRKLLPHLEETMEHKSSYMRLAQQLKRAWREDWDKFGNKTEQAKTSPQSLSPEHQWAMSESHAVIDCATHGRMPLADDPMTMRMFFPNHYKTMIFHGALNGAGAARAA